MLIAAIPSPSSNAIHLGDLQLRYYGMAIALGVFAAIWLADKRHVARGGNPEDFGYIGIRAALAGLLGARAYHVLTDWRSFEGRWGDVFKVWEGGLGIPGGILAGALVGMWAAKKRGMAVPYGFDVAAPALPLAQAIGRLGNWFNQELFGKPTDLPWAIEIDLRYRPEGYEQFATFHPAFLYEALWNLALCGLLLVLDKKKAIPRGKLFAVYVFGYGVGRLWIEALRIDKASHILGLRVNIWVSLFAIIGGLAWWLLGNRTADPATDAASTDASGSDSASPETHDRTQNDGDDEDADDDADFDDDDVDDDFDEDDEDADFDEDDADDDADDDFDEGDADADDEDEDDDDEVDPSREREAD